ncbi:hypothetical protein Fot_11363 [Forsythia ovata]|uniref:Uncharacterized protein n=1 Tax=Forsythia ovata TaxID=205694 RepID=A0ABD1WM69_9LAMI
MAAHVVFELRRALVEQNENRQGVEVTSAVAETIKKENGALKAKGTINGKLLAVQEKRKELEGLLSERKGQTAALVREIISLKSRLASSETEVNKLEMEAENVEAMAIDDFRANFHLSSDYEGMVKYFRNSTVKEMKKFV